MTELAMRSALMKLREFAFDALCHYFHNLGLNSILNLLNFGLRFASSWSLRRVLLTRLFH